MKTHSLVRKGTVGDGCGALSLPDSPDKRIRGDTSRATEAIGNEVDGKLLKGNI
jgi:hypothetical protein